jgi:HEAT repeat protein
LAVAVLAKTGRTAALAVLARAANDSDDRVRYAAIDAAPRWLAIAGPAAAGGDADRVRALLAERLASPVWQERQAAALALGALGQGARADVLTPALRDTSPFVREAATRALGRIAAGDAAAVGLLVAASKDDIAEVRAAAAAALAARRGDPAAKARLDELGKDPDAKVRAAAGAPTNVAPASPR